MDVLFDIVGRLIALVLISGAIGFGLCSGCLLAYKLFM